MLWAAHRECAPVSLSITNRLVQIVVQRRTFAQLLSQTLNVSRPSDVPDPFLRHARHPIKRAGNLPGGGGYAVGVITEVGSQQNGIFEVVGIPDGPQGCFECVNDIA